MNSGYVGQVVNLRRIGNPPVEGRGKSSGVFAKPAGRIANPPQIANLPHKDSAEGEAS